MGYPPRLHEPALQKKNPDPKRADWWPTKLLQPSHRPITLPPSTYKSLHLQQRLHCTHTHSQLIHLLFQFRQLFTKRLAWEWRLERVWLDQLGMSGSGKTCSGAKAASLALSTRVRRLNRHTWLLVHTCLPRKPTQAASCSSRASNPARPYVMPRLVVIRPRTCGRTQ